jgi:subtilisin family serine protease
MRRFLSVLAFLTCCLPFTSAQDALLDAALAGDVPALASAIAKGGDMNRRDAQGRTALMRAAGIANFHACRELLWAGADANAVDKSGQTAHDHVGEPAPWNAPLRLLLRSYAWLQKEAKPATKKPATPELVMIMEDTVNYLHPRIKAAYKTNVLEEIGVTGNDDDRNGFVDDVWGWEPVLDKPYEIPELQIDAYLAHRDAIGRILRVHNDFIEGKITFEESERRLNEYTNPLAAIMGPLPELSDRKFLDMLMNAAHGSHVAGIVLDASENKAKLHTLSMNFVEASKRMCGKETTRILDEIHAKSCDPAVVLEEVRAKVLEHAVLRGRRSSRYLQASGAGVANLSFGGGMGYARGIAQAQISRCQERRFAQEPIAAMLEDTDALLAHWGLEYYAATAAEFALVFYENPDVLFLVAAGNDDLNNDDEYIQPAYLARFFPNVVSVAATVADGNICSFSNYGVESVDLGAPGAEILSTVIPEAPVYMNGTSMATPYVAGVAALMRSLSPTTSAAELRRQLAYTVRGVEQLTRFTSTGGVVDRAAMKGLVQGSARERSHSHARIALNAVLLSDERFPRRVADARAAAEKAVKLDDKNGEAWHAKAVVLAVLDNQWEPAFTAIEKSVQLDPRSESAWIERAGIAAQLGKNEVVFASIGKAIDLLAGQGEAAEFKRARHLGLRASLYLQVGKSTEAAADARAARALLPELVLPPELEALL